MELRIENLHVSAEGKNILKGLSVTFKLGKSYAIVGANGNGKSTLLAAIMGDPNFEITDGKIYLDDQDVTELEVDERARLGIYLSMQNPVELSGISNAELIKTGIEKQTGKTASLLSTYVDMQEKAKDLRIEEALLEREVNVGFSGGEKKKNELLQMFMFKPKFAMLDEIDSGLDIDSINAVGRLINKAKHENKSFIIVSHYKDLYRAIKPDYGIIIRDGRVHKEVNYEELMKTLEVGFDD